MSTDYSITDEIIYPTTLVIFAILTTLFPALLGQSWFMPIIQTIGMTLFLLFVIRRGRIKRALLLLGIWLGIQFVVITLLTTYLPTQLDYALSDGFTRRTAYMAWFYAGSEAPVGVTEGLLTRLLELLGTTAGTMATGGLLGNWILVRSVNAAAFYTGSLLGALNSPLNALGALPIWTLLRICGYSLFTLLFAEPLLSGNWSLGYYLRHRRMYFLIGLSLILLALLLENTIPNLWRSLFN
ncbi:MAG: hypothetical protein AAF702_08510 [Chloroflexota bacterium]